MENEISFGAIMLVVLVGIVTVFTVDWLLKISQPDIKKPQTPKVIRTEDGGNAHTTWVDEIYDNGLLCRTKTRKVGGKPSGTPAVTWYRDDNDHMMVRVTKPDWA